MFLPMKLPAFHPIHQNKKIPMASQLEQQHCHSEKIKENNQTKFHQTQLPPPAAWVVCPPELSLLFATIISQKSSQMQYVSSIKIFHTVHGLEKKNGDNIQSDVILMYDDSLLTELEYNTSTWFTNGNSISLNSIIINVHFFNCDLRVLPQPCQDSKVIIWFKQCRRKRKITSFCKLVPTILGGIAVTPVVGFWRLMSVILIGCGEGFCV